jgi:hypothetical protein
LVDRVSSIGSENSQSDNEDDSWGKADLGKGLRENLADAGDVLFGAFGRELFGLGQLLFSIFIMGSHSREQTKQMTNPTVVKTIVQVPCSVTVFIITLKVKM